MIMRKTENDNSHIFSNANASNENAFCPDIFCLRLRDLDGQTGVNFGPLRKN